MSEIPDVGDVVIVDFDPQAGHEQAGKRPALVISPYCFNDKTGFAWLCPITNQAKGYPFEVPLSGTNKTTGVVLTDQMKSLDRQARNLHKVDKVDNSCISRVKDLISTILNI
ncbi:endoribonuclease MazF [Thioflexithrix psekupsensis]|uniref:mRNA-degrading endonuclease n=1 Tax=Thioflexithrix psekupsensis TaxID=1570016 RepID=A0A251XAC6_9GAMM|nr:endoribonuclease MazF [Thioflexithrix psekupsensis]OUD15263.1 mRNA-degrading endonuclease [Thioflexithrix psekupsensis]